MSEKSAMERMVVRTPEMDWKPLGPGTSVKILRVSAETGMWTMLLKMEKGAVFAPHKHLGPAEYFMLEGLVDVGKGVLERTGDYGYEPLGTTHEATIALEDSLMTFTSYGPIAFLDEKGNILQVLGGDYLLQEQAQNPQLSAKKVA
ncbi:2,4'-dihydroxyacetophenone dioxygenase family protein [Hyalangium rubrum]|uniref:2,4'-dihydroxyacetophenone dioxygenase family protein n=1 Tax=Hyalangium rubrum TaxID=3103134 RepID=A0ABU5HBG8_9BACT|nr:2,4'-dihydroxyacetophenone dioxygenase family protein [Hyalangium sp. s54d21]MDY7230811.1 2,4'-dihydroxyacetophenone dioxygenase family protein [Hyalangium sp. s54d21]